MKSYPRSSWKPLFVLLISRIIVKSDIGTPWQKLNLCLSGAGPSRGGSPGDTGRSKKPPNSTMLLRDTEHTYPAVECSHPFWLCILN